MQENSQWTSGDFDSQWLSDDLSYYPLTAISAAIRSLAEFLLGSSVLPVTAALGFILVLSLILIFADSDSIEFFRRKLPKRKARPVVGYKVAELRTDGSLCGISGGGSYSFDDRGKLDPGFHCFKSIDLLFASSYAYSGNVVLEVLLYGDVVEHTNGYVGSNQRVLQLSPNPKGTECYECRRRSRTLYVDRSSLKQMSSWGSGREVYAGGISPHLRCDYCMGDFRRILKFFKGSNPKRQGRYVALDEHIGSLVARRGGATVGYAHSADAMIPTLIEA